MTPGVSQPMRNENPKGFMGDGVQGDFPPGLGEGVGAALPDALSFV